MRCAIQCNVIIAFFTILLLSDTAFAQVSGIIYHDDNMSAASYFDQEIGPEDTVLPDIEVFLTDGLTEQSVFTDSQGKFEFQNVTPGTYFLAYGLDTTVKSTSHSRPLRIPEAITEGSLTIVSFGDSIGKQGDPVPHPERLAAHFEELTDVTLHNIHVPGSRSWEWLPGDPEAYWEDRLEPLLPDADLVTFTVMGNDLDAYVDGMSPPYDVGQIIQNILDHPEYILEAIPRVAQIIDNIQTVNPDCDIIYAIYPNFGNSTYLYDEIGQTIGPIIQPLVAEVMELGMSALRFYVGFQENIVIADMMSYYGDQWITDYLVDIVHPNGEGHQDYADVMFETLGGVVVDGPKIGKDRLEGFFAPDLVPEPDDDDDDVVDDDDDTIDDDDVVDDDDDTVDDDDDSVDDDDDDDTTDDDDMVDDDTPAPSSDDDDNDDGCGC